ncbi:Thioredoxin [Chionoecetes opilio]|uniref:Thioredoxin n=1 Tax=Chionoecetes opilio TaxID=41210 RepID=A0A8J4XX92_CHIOP|nr:Thioredoxin [Chionoecetes opilio]
MAPSLLAPLILAVVVVLYQGTGHDDFNQQLKDAGQKLIVVDFYAVWCGPCKMIAPKLQEMSEQMNDVVFLKVDVDECEEVAASFAVSCMPTFLFFKDGKKVDSFSGANEEKIRQYIARLK